MSLKNPVTPPGIDPGTVRLVAQRLNHYATPGTKVLIYTVLMRKQSCYNIRERNTLVTVNNVLSLFKWYMKKKVTCLTAKRDY